MGTLAMISIFTVPLKKRPRYRWPPRLRRTTRDQRHANVARVGVSESRAWAILPKSNGGGIPVHALGQHADVDRFKWLRHMETAASALIRFDLHVVEPSASTCPPAVTPFRHGSDWQAFSRCCRSSCLSRCRRRFWRPAAESRSGIKRWLSAITKVLLSLEFVVFTSIEDNWGLTQILCRITLAQA